jgi:hypothetical protein
MILRHGKRFTAENAELAENLGIVVLRVLGDLGG